MYIVIHVFMLSLPTESKDSLFIKLYLNVLKDISNSHNV